MLRSWRVIRHITIFCVLLAGMQSHDLMLQQGSLGNVVFHWAVLCIAKKSVLKETWEAVRPPADLMGFLQGLTSGAGSLFAVGLSCALWDVQQHPWPPPTRCQELPLLSLELR